MNLSEKLAKIGSGILKFTRNQITSCEISRELIEKEKTQRHHCYPLTDTFSTRTNRITFRPFWMLLSELDSARDHFTYFRPKLEIFNNVFYRYIHFWTFHIILRRTNIKNSMLWAIVWEIASSYGLMTSSLLIRHFSQISAKISRGLGSKFL